MRSRVANLCALLPWGALSPVLAGIGGMPPMAAPVPRKRILVRRHSRAACDGIYSIRGGRDRGVPTPDGGNYLARFIDHVQLFSFLRLEATESVLHGRPIDAACREDREEQLEGSMTCVTILPFLPLMACSMAYPGGSRVGSR